MKVDITNVTLHPSYEDTVYEVEIGYQTTGRYRKKVLYIWERWYHRSSAYRTICTMVKGRILSKGTKKPLYKQTDLAFKRFAKGLMEDDNE